MSEAIAHHGVGDRIGDVLPGIHIGLRLLSEFCALSNVRPKDVPGGDVRDSESTRKNSRLGSFAGTRGSHENKTHVRT